MTSPREAPEDLCQYVFEDWDEISEEKVLIPCYAIRRDHGYLYNEYDENFHEFTSRNTSVDGSER